MRSHRSEQTRFVLRRELEELGLLPHHGGSVPEQGRASDLSQFRPEIEEKNGTY